MCVPRVVSLIFAALLSAVVPLFVPERQHLAFLFTAPAGGLLSGLCLLSVFFEKLAAGLTGR